MISRVEGKLLAHSFDRIEVMTSGGTAFEILVPLEVIERIPSAGGDISLFTAMVVREDSWTLYGFSSHDERRLFQRLLGTTGVGPALAMSLISTLTGDTLVRAVRDGDLATLTRVPRVGKKLAERLVLELRDKLESASGAAATATKGSAPSAGPAADAIRALEALGYSAADAERAVRTGLENAPKNDNTADLIRRSLAALAK